MPVPRKRQKVFKHRKVYGIEDVSLFLLFCLINFKDNLRKTVMN